MTRTHPRATSDKQPVAPDPGDAHVDDASEVFGWQAQSSLTLDHCDDAASKRRATERSMAVHRNPFVDAEDDDWRTLAACRDVDANLFFPNGSTGPALGQLQAAKAFCRSCPVQHACLEFALETNQEDGVWGGKDETERRRLRREWRQSRKQVVRPVSV